MVENWVDLEIILVWNGTGTISVHWGFCTLSRVPHVQLHILDKHWYGCSLKYVWLCALLLELFMFKHYSIFCSLPTRAARSSQPDVTTSGVKCAWVWKSMLKPFYV
jgi:hypothetical protein